VRLGDRRVRAEGVERHHEREGLAGEVVGARRADEVDPVLADAGAGERLAHDRHQHLDLVEIGDRPHEGGLGERDDGDLTHQTLSL
jgi:hypothetical protein